MIAGVQLVALSATSISRLMMSPGAVWMNIDATPATGRKTPGGGADEGGELRLEVVDEDVGAQGDVRHGRAR